MTIKLLSAISGSKQKQKDLGEKGLRTWQTILEMHSLVREDQIVDIFHVGLKKLGIVPNKIPSLNDINKRLKAETGFQGIFVDGLEAGDSFFPMLARRLFPIGNFIRDAIDLNYTPAPDIVHDVYGHIPFLMDRKYADFCNRFGLMASEFLDKPKALRQFERFFWFTLEFGLIKTAKGIRVFGAGIASSLEECKYSLSKDPEVIPFDIDTIRKQEFRIDEMQNRLFLLDSVDQLYNSLDEFYQKVASDQ